MSTLLTTSIVAIFLVLAALALLGISYLFCGKISWKLGSCGKDPTKRRDKNVCDIRDSCSLCSKAPKKKELKADHKNEENEEIE